MAVDAKMIKELRDKTGMGITDCKKALEQSGGNLEEAEMVLRKTQKEKAIKKADRPTGQGVVAVKIADDRSRVALVELACEQEPTTANERFVAFLEMVLSKTLENGVKDLDALMALSSDEGTVQDSLTSLAGTVGENVQLKRATTLDCPAGSIIGSYAHFNKKAAAVCILSLDGCSANDDLQAIANDVCMHSVATRPAALDRDGVPADLVAKEKEVFLDEVKDKPENIQEKIVEGKLNKFYSEKCLLEQIFVKDPDGKNSIQQVVDAAAKAAGGKACIAAFARMELGL